MVQTKGGGGEPVRDRCPSPRAIQGSCHSRFRPRERKEEKGHSLLDVSSGRQVVFVQVCCPEGGVKGGGGGKEFVEFYRCFWSSGGGRKEKAGRHVFCQKGEGEEKKKRGKGRSVTGDTFRGKS